MKKGFTLAEVLITLAIIGVVAAITIPTVINNYQKQNLYSQFVYTYNTFSRVFQLMYTDGETSQAFLASNKGSTTDETQIDGLFNSLLTHLKYTVKCEAREKRCFKDNSNIFYKNLSGTTKNEIFYMSQARPIYSLPNGTDFSYVYSGIVKKEGAPGPDFSYSLLSIVADVNGIEKGPNLIGRDLFIFFFPPFTQTLLPSNSRVISNLGELHKGKTPMINNEKAETLCDPNNNDKDSGTTCGIKLMREKKMNY